MRNITLSADEASIEAARARARLEQTTLNEQFRRWLAEYGQTHQRLARYEQAMSTLRGRLEVGSQFTRDEMNER